MSASNVLYRTFRAGCLALIATTAAGAAIAQAQRSAVSDADIERAKKSQPVITERDIARANANVRQPTEQEVNAVAKQAAPKMDALPSPGSTPPLDLGSLAKGYDAATESSASATALKSGPALLAFVSFSMPEAALQRVVEQAARSRARVVLRGFANGSMRETVQKVQTLIGKREVEFQIDPQSFDRFAVVKAPTYVLIKDGAKEVPCRAGACVSSDAFVAVSGDVSLDYALEHIEHSAPRFARDARRYLKRLRK